MKAKYDAQGLNALVSSRSRKNSACQDCAAANEPRVVDVPNLSGDDLVRVAGFNTGAWGENLPVPKSMMPEAAE